MISACHKNYEKGVIHVIYLTPEGSIFCYSSQYINRVVFAKLQHSLSCGTLRQRASFSLHIRKTGPHGCRFWGPWDWSDSIPVGPIQTKR